MANEGEIKLPNEAGEPVVFKSIPPAVMQAIYHEATGKTEKLEREYKDSFVVTRGDIEQLAHRITQTVQQFDVTACSERIVIEHHKNDTIRYSSFERLASYSDANPHPISVLTLQWKFLLSVPIVKRYHEYQVVVRIDGTIYDEENPLYQVYAGRFAPAAIDASVDFVDYVVARTFHAAIEEWVRTLSTRKKSAFVRWCEANKTEIWTFAPPLVAATSLLSWPSWWAAAADWATGPADRLPIWIVTMVVVAVVSFIMPQLVFHYVMGPLRSFERSAIIRVNRGDELNAAAIDRQVKGGPVRAIATLSWFVFQVLISLFSGLILGVILGVPSS